MARKKGGRRGRSANDSENSEDPAPVDDGPATVEANVPTQKAAAADVTPLAPFDATASSRVVAACAGIYSLATVAVGEATDATTPFLSFAQRSRIRALATRFDASASGGVVFQPAPARAVETKVVEGGGLRREEIDAIVAHRVEIAVTELLKKLGVSPDRTISAQIEKSVESEVGAIEGRLLDNMRRHLTESLEMLESTLDERIADFLDVEPKKEAPSDVEARLQEARENLLKNIDEVRTIDVGFDMDFAAGIVEVDRTTGSHDAIGIEQALAAQGDAIELGGEDIELGGEDIVVGGEDIELGGEEVELGGEDIELGGEDIELGGEELGADDIEIGVDDIEIGVDDIEIGVDDIEAIELSDASPAPIALSVGEEDTATARVQRAEEDIAIAVSDDGDDDGVVILDGDDDLDALDLITVADMQAPEADLEEISVVRSLPKSAEAEDSVDEAALKDALEVELEEEPESDVGLMTLGEGPDEIRFDDIQNVADELEVIIDDDDMIDVDLDDDGDSDSDDDAQPTGETKDAMVAKYMDKASQMSARRAYTPAMELYSKVLDLDPGNFDALISRGLIYSETKDYKKATEDFRTAQEIAPDRAGSYYGLAELHYNRRQFNKAIKNYSQALTYDDKVAEAWCRRGLSYYYQKNYKKAYLDLFRAYDINPDLPKIKNFLKLVRNKLEETGG